jgi:hypothetical protein
MDLISLKFFIFVVKLSLCILPFVIVARLLFFVKDKDNIRRRISKKILGEPELIQSNFFNIVYVLFIACIVLLGASFVWVFFIS